MTINVEIADTQSKREAGLMYRKSMSSDAGMLFVFDDPQTLAFWGSNTYIPLDIAFIDNDNKIEAIKKIVPLSTKAVKSDGTCKYALETVSNFFENNNINIGDSISVDNDRVTFRSCKEGK
jgi:uncharacterized membrane protein (UPF0127 family)